MSPSASCAKSVMPTRTEPSVSPGVRTHSCSLVYLRFSGYTGTPVLGRRWSGWGVSGRLLAGAGLRILGSRGSRTLVMSTDSSSVDLRPRRRRRSPASRSGPVEKVIAVLQHVRVADHVEDVGRLEELAVELDAADGVVEGAVARRAGSSR